MEKILFNLAMIHALNFCREYKIDCSGSHLYKYPRRFTYALRDETAMAIVTVTFHKASVPTYSIPK